MDRGFVLYRELPELYLVGSLCAVAAGTLGLLTDGLVSTGMVTAIILTAVMLWSVSADWKRVQGDEISTDAIKRAAILATSASLIGYPASYVVTGDPAAIAITAFLIVLVVAALVSIRKAKQRDPYPFQ